MTIWILQVGWRDAEFIYGAFTSKEHAVIAATSYRSDYFEGAKEDLYVYEVEVDQVLKRDDLGAYIQWPVAWMGQSS